MIIPEGVDHGKFYRAAKERGVKISSRYKYVYALDNKRDLNWVACIRRKELKMTKRFPFTANGEKQANDFIVRLLSNPQPNKEV